MPSDLLSAALAFRCVANDITYNSTMKAAERGGHWELVLPLGLKSSAGGLERRCLPSEHRIYIYRNMWGTALTGQE